MQAGPLNGRLQAARICGTSHVRLYELSDHPVCSLGMAILISCRMVGMPVILLDTASQKAQPPQAWHPTHCQGSTQISSRYPTPGGKPQVKADFWTPEISHSNFLCVFLKTHPLWTSLVRAEVAANRTPNSGRYSAELPLNIGNISSELRGFTCLWYGEF